MNAMALALLGFTLAVLPDLAAGAQTSSVLSIDTADSLRFAEASKRIKPGSTLRVYTAADPSGALQFRGTNIAPWGFREDLVPDSATWAGSKPSIRWNQVQKIQVKGTAAGTGAALGGLLFGAAGIAVGIGLAKDELFNPDGDKAAGFITVGALAGVLGGSFLGAVVGTMIPSYKTVYETKAQK